MLNLDRTNTSFIGRWWWTVDRYMLVALMLIMGFGAVLVMAASPSVADRFGLRADYFINRQMVFLCMGFVVMCVVSMLSPRQVRHIALLGLLGCYIGMVLVLYVGEEVKGATRWLSVGGTSIQPSEFMKPFLAVVTGWILAEKNVKPGYPGFSIAIAVYALTALLLVLQPDMGMTVTITAVWLGQMFLAGIALYWVLGAVFGAAMMLTTAYFFMPHVARRINMFLNPEASENYQVEKSLQAFANGGLYGRGPGEGVIKSRIPDAHTDFIFAVAGEELGMLACIFLIALFAIVVIRGFVKVFRQSDLFILFAGAGILMGFGMQAMINMGVALHLLPTKGMTLPFISYGGSSVLAMSIATGMALALTRKRYGASIQKWQKPAMHIMEHASKESSRGTTI